MTMSLRDLPTARTLYERRFPVADTAAVDPAAAETPGQLAPAFQADDPRVHSYLLLLRFGLINLVGFALLGACYVQGWIDTVLAADGTGITPTIIGLFLAGLALCARKVWQTSRELNGVRGGNPAADSRAGIYLCAIAGVDAGSRSLSASALKLKLVSRISAIRHIGATLVLLGLIGTVVGFIIALQGVDAESVADVSAIGPMVSTMIGGMSVALYTTLVGSVLNIWLMVGYQTLTTGTANLITAIVALGESHARS